jgi:DNA-binding ferritin-like protein
MEKPATRMLKRESSSNGTNYSAAPAGGGSLDTMVSACVSELMNGATSFHKLHLKVTGAGSYAAHKALNELYDALPGHADDLAEGFQGASEKLLSYKDVAPRSLESVTDGLSYIREMKEMVNGLQAKMPYSEIVNDLDTIKSTLNGIKYKLLFLK